MAHVLVILSPVQGVPVPVVPIDRILQTTEKDFGIAPRAFPVTPARRAGL